jgi:VanZ family protein
MAFIGSVIKISPPIRWTVVILWTIFISILLIQPEQNQLINTGIPPGPNTLEREILFTSIHFISFGITCALWFWAWFGHLNFSKSLLLAIGFAIVIGSVTEYLQSYSPDRYPSWIDFFANCTGTLLMGYIIWRKQHIINTVRVL